MITISELEMNAMSATAFANSNPGVRGEGKSSSVFGLFSSAYRA